MPRSAILQRGKQGNPDPVAAEYLPLARGGVLPGQAAPGVPQPIAWLPYGGGQAASEQIGVYGDAYLNQFPAYYNQPQLHSAVEWLRSGYYTPTISAVPYFQQTMYPQPLGGQRVAAPAGAPVGPITSKGWRSRVTQSQIAQSGASAFSWAQNLTGG